MTLEDKLHKAADRLFCSLDLNEIHAELREIVREVVRMDAAICREVARRAENAQPNRNMERSAMNAAAMILKRHRRKKSVPRPAALGEL